MKNKTHWLKNPNKNYLGHWDLPEEKDLVLTIESAEWEIVVNPVDRKEEEKRVIRFKEKKYKPMICNQTNAESIIYSTGVKYMEDAKGSTIELYIDKVRDSFTKKMVDCIRVRRNPTKKIQERKEELEALLELKRNVLSNEEIEKASKVIEKEITLKFNGLKDFLNSK